MDLFILSAALNMPVSATVLPGFPQQDCCLHGITFYILRRIKLFCFSNSFTMVS